MISGANESQGTTPLHPDHAEQLIPNLSTREQLNEWERQNILSAQNWAYSPRVLGRSDPLSEGYARKLHEKMFDETWKWAGQYRRADHTNIGCPFAEIYQRLPILLADVRYWVEHNIFDIDEIAVRFHQRLVGQIHAFPNGNGRHARLLASILVVKHGRDRLSWGRVSIAESGSRRDAYLAALRGLDADDRNVRPLLELARF